MIDSSWTLMGLQPIFDFLTGKIRLSYLSRKKVTLRVPISTYTFSRLITIHFLKELVKRIRLKIKSICPLVIISLFLITFSLDCVLKLLEENWCWAWKVVQKPSKAPFKFFSGLITLFCLRTTKQREMNWKYARKISSEFAHSEVN